MHYHTCKSLLNTLGRAVEQLTGCLAKQQKSAVKVKVQLPDKCQRPSAKLSYEYLGKVTPIAPSTGCSIRPVPNRNHKNTSARLWAKNAGEGVFAGHYGTHPNGQN